MGRKLYVGNLPYQTDENELQGLFGRSGVVEKVTVSWEEPTGKEGGFAIAW